jgi:hypothetical protein
MKTHILYIGRVLAAVALGTLAGASLLAPAGVAVQPEDGKGDIAPPAGLAIQPEGGKDGVAAPAPPKPAQDIQSQEPKLRHTIKAPVAPANSGDLAGYHQNSMGEFRVFFSPDSKTLVGAQN